MVQYAKSLSEAIEKSTEQRKSMAPEPTQVCYKMLIGKTLHFTCKWFKNQNGSLFSLCEIDYNTLSPKFFLYFKYISVYIVHILFASLCLALDLMIT